MTFRAMILALLLGGYSWLQFIHAYPSMSYVQQATDWIDERPAKRILMIGNSRSFYNDMPEMLRNVADANDATEKYQTVEHLKPGARLRDHWGNAKLHTLLTAERWDEIIIQAQSAAHFRTERDHFLENAKRLIKKARANADQVRVLVTWAYDPDEQYSAADMAWYHRRIQEDHAKLSRITGVELTNLGEIWEANKNSDFHFAMTTDGNHPTEQASYLIALTLFADMERRAVEGTAYLPDGVAANEAEQLRAKVSARIEMFGDI